MSGFGGGYNGSSYGGQGGYGGQQSYSGGGGGGYGGDQGYGGYGGGGQSCSSVNVPQGKVGRVIGKGGSKIREIQEVTGCEVRILKDAPADGGMVPAELKGSDDSIEAARCMIEELCQEDPRGYGGGGGGFSRGGGGGGGFGGGGGYGGGRGGGDVAIMYIESNQVGKVIGRGGSNIRSLQESSGCKINVKQQDARPNVHDGQIPVELTGTSGKATDEAKRMIQELLSTDSYGGASW